MKLNKTLTVSGIFAVVILITTLIFWRREDLEFVYYNIIFVVLSAILLLRHRLVQFRYEVFAGMLTLMIMHLLGGLIHIDGVRLYDVYFGIIRYDNIVHIVMGATFAFLTSDLFPHFKEWRTHHKAAFCWIVLLITLGLGAMVEIFEYIGVEFLQAPGVGDYVNNARDLVCDAVGGLLGALMMLPLAKHDDTR